MDGWMEHGLVNGSAGPASRKEEPGRELGRAQAQIEKINFTRFNLNYIIQITVIINLIAL